MKRRHRDEASLFRLRTAVTRTAERLDILVNNAGGWRHARYDQITIEDCRWTFDTNVLSVLLCSRRFADLMIARRYGRIDLATAARKALAAEDTAQSAGVGALPPQPDLHAGRRTGEISARLLILTLSHRRRTLLNGGAGSAPPPTLLTPRLRRFPRSGS